MSHPECFQPHLLLIASLIAATMPVRAEDQPVARAREIWQLMATGRFDEFVATGDEKVKAALSPERAAQIWAGLGFQLGQYQEIQSATNIKQGENDAIILICRFARGTATVRVVLDQQGRLSGLWTRTTKILPIAPPYEPPAYVNQQAFYEEPALVVCGEFELPGTLTIPKTGAPHPAIVLVHGSGSADEDETFGPHKPFRDLAWGLASRGVAVLRYEKRNHKYGRSTKTEDVTLEWEVIDDALAAARILRARPDIDDQRVVVLGHSLGGMAAPFIASRDPRLAGIVLMAANARSILDLIEDQLAYLANLDGNVSEDEREELVRVKQATTAIRDGRPSEVEEPLLGAPAAYWAHLHQRDPVKVAAGLKCRILIIHGGRDYQVTRADYALWHERLSNHKNVTIKLHETLNHLMVAGDGPSTPAEYQQPGHVDEAVIEDIANWICQR